MMGPGWVQPMPKGGADVPRVEEPMLGLNLDGGIKEARVESSGTRGRRLE